ncbi:MAG: efflux RND transporter permease subunit, partial [Deltaproteobacteria bacterium]|nr:efflux RND transporter permease subunit [Deltaproteobacteria bacterium]
MIRAFVRNRAPIALVTVCIFFFGLFTYIELPREAFPDIDIPVVMVSTPYTGVSPEDIESLITVPIESELAGLKDLKKMTSVSAEGVSLVTLEFEPSVVIEDALQRVRDRISRARSDLPEDAEETDIREVSMTDVPIMIVTIAGPVDEEVLKIIGEGLEDEFTRINGVLDADLAGGRTRQFRVQIDPHRLTHYSLKLDDVIDAIRDENVNIPG